MGSEIIFSRHIFVKSTTFCSVSTFYAIYAEVNSVKYSSPLKGNGIRLLQSETREGRGNVENYERRKTPENLACASGSGDHREIFDLVQGFFSFQVDALLEFDCSAQDLNNGVINCSFMLLFRDLIRSQMQVISILRIIFIQVVCLLQ